MKIRVCLACLLLATSAVAQLGAEVTIHRLRVRLIFANGVCDANTRVVLMGHNSPVAEAVANDQCVAEFVNVPEGIYHLNISGQGLSNTDAGLIDASTGSSEFEVKVNRAGDRAPGMVSSPFVSANSLGIPSKARKEFDKANGWIQKENFTRAIETLNKAIVEYPAYADAYNNLGVVYGRLGDREREKEALHNAIAADGHFAPAYVNLGRMSIAAQDFAGAQTALVQAASLDPTNAMTLVLLAYAQFMSRQYDETIATAKRAHNLQGDHAFAHQVAAGAFEQKRQATNAAAELKLFLKEEPTGTRAEIARKELAAVLAIGRSAATAVSNSNQ